MLCQRRCTSAVSTKDIRVTLLGTASGPRAFVDIAGISTLVEAGGERLLFDAGRGVMQRLVQAGFQMNAVTQLFLMHLHSDHVIGVPDLMLTPWSAAPERKVPLEVWGPDGTRDSSPVSRMSTWATFGPGAEAPGVGVSTPPCGTNGEAAALTGTVGV